MKPPPISYIRVDNLDEAANLLSNYGMDARILSGGQTLIAMLNMRLLSSSYLIDISAIDSNRSIWQSESRLHVTCIVKQRELLDYAGLSQAVPLISQSLPFVGHPQTRARGTVCGSIAHADPTAELPLCLTALDGTVNLLSTQGRRSVAARDFFQGALQTACRDDEIVESVSFPCAKPDTGYAFDEVGLRHGDYATIAVAAVVDPTRVRMTVAGAADRPTCLTFPKGPNSDTSDHLNELAWRLLPQSRDEQARYKRHLIRRLGQRVIERAASCVN